MNRDEQIPLHALNCLPADEARELEAELKQSEALTASLKSFQPAVEALGLLAEPVAPPPGLKARLQQRIQNRTSQPGSFTVNKAAERKFSTLGPGISKSILRSDAEAQRVTMLLKVDAGARLPSHKHVGPEETLVLTGDLRGAGFVLHAGDYQLNDGGTIHGELWSEQGCTVLVISSTKDCFIKTESL